MQSLSYVVQHVTVDNSIPKTHFTVFPTLDEALTEIIVSLDYTYSNDEETKLTRYLTPYIGAGGMIWLPANNGGERLHIIKTFAPEHYNAMTENFLNEEFTSICRFTFGELPQGRTVPDILQRR